MKNSSLLVLGVLALVGCPSKPAPPPNVPDAQPTSPVASTTPADAGADQKSSTDQQVTNVVVNEPAPTIEVFFSPNGGCAEKIVARIAAIQPGGTIRMLAYGFTSKDISDAMIAAKKRGVDVQAVFDKSDKSTQGSKSYDFIINKIPTWFDGKHAIMHDKVIIFDGKTVETGSYNYTLSAEKANAENCIFIGEAKTAKHYSDDWDLHKSHSDPAVTQ